MGSNRIESEKKTLKQQTQGGFRDSLRATRKNKEHVENYQVDGREMEGNVGINWWTHVRPPPQKNRRRALILNYLRSNQFLLLHPYYCVSMQVI